MTNKTTNNRLGLWLAPLVLVLTVAGLPAAGWAQDSADPSPGNDTAAKAESSAEATEPRTPDAIVRDSVESVRDKIRENREEYEANPEVFHAMIEREIVPNFDLPLIARLVLGRHARQATPEQRRRFARAFKNTLINSYASAMLQYNDEVETAYDPVRVPEGAQQITVNTRLLRKDGPDVPVAFVMHQVDGRWLIYDVTVEGISLVTNFRAQFHQRIREEGLDAVIEQLENGEINTDVPQAG